MNFKTIALILLAAAAMAGCKESLEVEPLFDIPTEEALDSQDDVETALNGAYAGLHSSHMYNGFLRSFPILIADQVEITPGQQNRASDISVFNRNLVTTGSNTYRQAYRTINRANNILAALNNNDIQPEGEFGQENLDRIRGEALFIRGLVHFEVLRLWSQQWGSESGLPPDPQQDGIVLRTEPADGDDATTRTTREACYNQITADLKKAAELLPETFIAERHPQRYFNAADKFSAWAILSRVYFQKATPAANDSAKFFAEQVIGSTPGSAGSFPLSPLSGPSNNVLAKEGFKSAPEILFQVMNFPTNTNVGGLISKFSSTPNFPSPQYSVRREFVNSNPRIEANRQNWIEASTNESGTFTFVKKYINDENNVIVIRSAELVLIRGEVNALNGNANAALEDLNLVRQRAGLGEITASDLDTTGAGSLRQAVLDELVKERSRELFFEGDRLHNFRRMAAYNANQEPVYRENGELVEVMGGETANTRIFNTLPWNSTEFLMRIPDQEIFANPNLSQNP